MSAERTLYAVQLILYAKLQYNQINFTIYGHKCPPNFSVDCQIHLILNMYSRDPSEVF